MRAALRVAMAVALAAVLAGDAWAPAGVPSAPATASRAQQEVYAALVRVEHCVRWRNPGCLKYARQPGAARGPYGYAVFENLAAGEAALWRRVRAGRGQTVREFLSGYNPGVERYPQRVAVLAGLDLEAVL